MNISVVDMIWNQLQDEIKKIERQSQVNKARSERAETAGGVDVVLFSQLPKAADGAADGDLLKVSNARKVGEAAGAGTGTLCYYNVATDSWFRVGDDTAVAI